MRKVVYFLLAVCMLLTLASQVSLAQQDQSSQEMKAWMEYMTPGKEHEALAKATGEWAFEMKMYMEPGKEPTVTKGTAKFDMLMGGRYQRSVHTADFMGMPFEGMSLIGFDNVKKAYISTWIDNMGTGVMTMEGKYDEATKTITMRGKMVEPAMGKETDVREVVRHLDDKNFEMEMYCVMNGAEVKMFESKYTKK